MPQLLHGTSVDGLSSCELHLEHHLNAEGFIRVPYMLHSCNQQSQALGRLQKRHLQDALMGTPYHAMCLRICAVRAPSRHGERARVNQKTVQREIQQPEPYSKQKVQ